MNFLLVFVRGIHFASVVLLAGAIFFDALIARPTFKRNVTEGLRDAIGRQLSRIAWAALAVALLSGAAWLVFLAGEIGGSSVTDALATGTAWTVLIETQFGTVAIARLAMVLVLAVLLCVSVNSRTASAVKAISVLLTAALLGSLAWSGHAAATPGFAGAVHIAADTLHLIAAGAWIGALLPLALMFRGATRSGDPVSIVEVHKATQRFSILGMVSVAVIFMTGLINTYELVGTVAALTGTDYGRLLLVKINLFVVMVSIATVNRLHITPRLSTAEFKMTAARQLQRNSLAEFSIGILIVGIVAVLGRMPPNVSDHAGHH